MKTFDIDYQTLADLDIFSSPSSKKDVFSYFNSTATIGGWDRLMVLFQNPTNDLFELEKRKLTIQFLINTNIDFSLNKETLDYIEFYLRQSNTPRKYLPILWLPVMWEYHFTQNHINYQLKEGVVKILTFFASLSHQIQKLDVHTSTPSLIIELRENLKKVMSRNEITKYFEERRKISAVGIAKCDYIFRKEAFSAIKSILNILYELDAFMSVATASRKYNLSFPEISKSSTPYISINSIFHPFLENPVSNDIAIENGQNVCFLTGANMSGKSTLIKSVAISVYLAHLGFPVPATKMKLSLLNGLTTTINLFDDLGVGRSHFYNEVLRIKSIAEKIENKSHFLIIFDELFRGTNVKDAFDSSLSVIELFSQISDSLFIVSTHIVEVAEALSFKSSINFQCFKTHIKNNELYFDRKLQFGISSDRLGYQILKKENVIDILQHKVNRLAKATD